MIKEFAKELFPPGDDGKPLSPLTRWRIIVGALCSSMFAFMAWALSPYGFALAEDFNKLRSNVDDVRLSQLELQIYDAKQSECSSTDSGSRRFFAARVSELGREYQRLSNLVANIPPCPDGSQNGPNRKTTNF